MLVTAPCLVSGCLRALHSAPRAGHPRVVFNPPLDDPAQAVRDALTTAEQELNDLVASRRNKGVMKVPGFLLRNH